MKGILPIVAVVGGLYFIITRGSELFSGEGGCKGCGCADCGDKEERNAEDANQDFIEEWQGESYPTTYDPVHDFLPRYRFPPTSSWSKAYNPADSFRPLDYQTVSFDKGTRCEGGVE